MARNIITGEEIIPFDYNGITTPGNNQPISQTTPTNGGGNMFPFYSPNGVNGTTQTTPSMIMPTIVPNQTSNVTNPPAPVSGGQVTGDPRVTTPSNIYTPGETTTPTPTVSNMPSLVQQETPEEKYLREQEYNRANIVVDEGAIRRNQMEIFQKEIDALNAVYAVQKQEATQRGMGRLGSDAAIQARRGLLGSTFGGAQTESVTGVNVQEQNAIDAEKSTKMAEIMGNVRKSVIEETERKRKAMTEGADAYIVYAKGNLDRKNKRVLGTVKALIDSGIDATEEDLAQMAKELGVDISVIQNEYIKSKKEDDAAKKKLQQEEQKIQSELDSERVSRQKTGLDMTKPFDAGGYIFTYNPETNSYSKEESRSVAGTNGIKAPSSTEIKSFINTQIATPEFKTLSKDQKKDFILSNGGTPSDYEY